MKEELKAIIEAAYAQAREVMQAKKGTWTKEGRATNMAFRALEVACRKLGIDTPPLHKRPDSVKHDYKYNKVEQLPTQDESTSDFIATQEEKPKRKSKKANDII